MQNKENNFMENTKAYFALITISLFSTFCFSQTSSNQAINLVGCWQTKSYTTSKTKTEFPKEIKMLYTFNCDNSYKYTVIDDTRKINKEQTGTYTISDNTLTLLIEESKILLKIKELLSTTLKMETILESETGTFLMTRILCK